MRDDAARPGRLLAVGRWVGPALYAGLLCAALALSGCQQGARPSRERPSGAASRERAPNVVLITVESLRTDHVGLLGGKSRLRPEVPLTPNIDALAAASVVYPDAHSVTSWTLASHASLFTGLYPTVHRTQRATQQLSDAYETLAERLAEHGYQTAGVVSGPYLRPAYNLHQGFELYDFAGASLHHREAHADVTNPLMERGIRRFLEHERDPRKPFFLFCYWWDPHYDFLPPPPYDTMYRNGQDVEIDLRGFGTRRVVNKNIPPAQLAYVYSQYEGEIRWTDEHLGRLFAMLKRLGIWDDTLVILTADHGEEFFDHGEKGHFRNIYAETIHVPLVIKYPRGGPVGIDERLVSLVDVFPTVLEVTGTPAATGIDGESLLAPAPSPDRDIFFELHSSWRVFNPAAGEAASRTVKKTWLGVRHRHHKLIVHVEAKRARLFDVGRDPREQHDLIHREADTAHALARTIDRWQERSRDAARRFAEGGLAHLSEAERERLRALGYLHD